MPARIIDPPTGASTCALGSHWWTKYIGNFTKKAVAAKAVKVGILYKWFTLNIKKYIDLQQFFWMIIIMVKSKGKEAKSV